MTEHWNKERFDEMVKNGLSEIYHKSFPPAWPKAIKSYQHILAEEDETAFAGEDHELCAAVIATFKSKSSDYQTRLLGRRVSNNDAFYAYYLLGNAFYSEAAKKDETPHLLKQAIDYYKASVNFAKYSRSNDDSLKFWPLFAHYALALSVIDLQDEYNLTPSDFKEIILGFSEECKRVNSEAGDVKIILPNEFLKCVNNYLRSFGSHDAFPSGKIVSDKSASYIASSGTVSAAPPSPIRADGAPADLSVADGTGGEAPSTAPSKARRLISKLFAKS